MDREALIAFLKDNLRVVLSVESRRYENDTRIGVELVLIDNGNRITIDNDVQSIEYGHFQFCDEV